MLQAMQAKVTEEGEKEKHLVQKFMCYCTTNKGALGDTIAAAEAKGPQVSAAIEESTAEKAQLEEDLKAHKEDREAAKSSLKEANALREKQAAEFAARKAEVDSNTAAMGKAIKALEKGAAGGFLQTGAAQVVRNFMSSRRDMIEVDRQTVLAFLSGGQSSDYSPQSGQITGILKQLYDEMTGDLAEATAAEEKAIEDHAGLVKAKKAEIAALTEAIEKDKAFLKELEEGCGTKESEWAERQKVRADELVALAETIKVLNDDDALELFKKAMPVKGESFVQLTGRS